MVSVSELVVRVFENLRSVIINMPGRDSQVSHVPVAWVAKGLLPHGY